MDETYIEDGFFEENIVEDYPIEEPKSKVYVLTDEQDRITRCEGGYTMGNIENIDEWTLIDGGTGDRFNLCQTHYFPDLYTMEGIPLWKLEDGKPVERTKEEIQADIAAILPTAPDPRDAVIAQLMRDVATLKREMSTNV